MPTIFPLLDIPRGCGHRKEGALYLVTDGKAEVCNMLPLPLDICPTCHAGIKPARGWTWVDVASLFSTRPDQCGSGDCDRCPLAVPTRLTHGKAGLLWIGEAFYKTPHDWLVEAAAMGVSRRITAVPKDFVVGTTWVLAAHRKVILRQGEMVPGIFSYFKPSRIEYVVKGTESEKELEKLEKRGLTLVKLVDPQQSLLPIDAA